MMVIVMMMIMMMTIMMMTRYAEGTMCTVSGWGTTTEGGSLARVLQKVMIIWGYDDRRIWWWHDDRMTFWFFYQQVDVPVVSDEHCRDSYGQDDITDSMICAGKIIIFSSPSSLLFLKQTRWYMSIPWYMKSCLFFYKFQNFVTHPWSVMFLFAELNKKKRNGCRLHHTFIEQSINHQCFPRSWPGRQGLLPGRLWRLVFIYILIKVLFSIVSIVCIFVKD